MNILYISHLDGAIANGLAWSVPESVKAQEQLDYVLWLNTSQGVLPHWKDVKAFTKSPRLKTLEGVQTPFNHPDMVVFEGFYDDLNDVYLARWLKKKGIPYIIIPRSALTIQAMNNHAKTKKRIAHWLFFNSFIKNAAAIQYLTQKECDDTKVLFDTRYFIVPNGINQQSVTKKSFHKDSIKGIFIGRIDIHQKGLDLLIDAIEQNKCLLRNVDFTLDLYGPCNQDYDKVKQLIDRKQLNDILFLKGEVRGEAKQNAILDADVFFLTSRFEGHPMGLIEALAYGLPCFVTPGSNMEKEITDARCGWVADFTEESISNQLVQMIKERDIFEEYSNRSKELSKRYEWNKLAELFHLNIENILKK